MSDVPYKSPASNPYGLDDLMPVRMPLWKEVLLWIAVLPGAVLGSLAAHFVAKVLIWLGSSRLGEDSWFYYIWTEGVTNGALGAALVYCGAYIAPRGKISVAITFAAAVLFLSGIAFFTFIAQRQWMSLLAVVSLNAGAIITAVTIAKGETRF